MAGSGTDKSKDTSAQGSPTKFDLDKLPAREPLPAALQKIVDIADKDESLYDEVWEGTYV